jgi:Ca-activated chloride channel family protein
MNARFTFAFLVCLALSVHAQEPVELDRIRFPGLLVRTTQPGMFIETPSVSTDISIQIRGIIARGLVRQRFENPTGRCVEAIYVFPLADDATVDAMRMKVGPRTITGEIKERQEASRVYAEAKREGRRASLLEQHRPNLFTVSVASIAAGESVDIEIEYQQTVTYEPSTSLRPGSFSLRVPLAIGPRYTPHDAPSPPPAVNAQRTDPKRNPVRLEIDLDSGIALATIASPTHELQPVPISETRTKLTPRNVQIASDRDFELVWTPRLGAMPQSIAFSELAGEHRYTLLMVFPPDVAARPAAILPRESIFVIDTSGSMGGPSIEQAKQALLTALKRLRSSDSFNVIAFSDSARKLFDRSRRADRDVVDEALGWVGALESNGGTEMSGALQLALEDADTPTDHVRQVVFITDGQVGNEAQIFQYIREHLGSARIFTIGIGAAPNSYFMRTAARAGRGTFTHIGDTAEVESKMTEMFVKLESPVLSNLALTLDRDAEVWPEQIPDLYAGEPIVITSRTPAASTLSGRIAATGWNQSFTTTGEQSQTGIAKLWARQKIDTLRDSVFTGANADAVRAEIVALGLAHHLVTEHTSLVAVDTTPSGIDPRTCTSELVPVNLPNGWGGTQGALPQTATPAMLWIVIGLALLAAAYGVRH